MLYDRIGKPPVFVISEISATFTLMTLFDVIEISSVGAVYGAGGIDARAKLAVSDKTLPTRLNTLI